ncbi:MAG: hypothetical protein GX621_09095 [Pirellulaceae bacterium]|nr:hypothetical protein [Pirellulaceae bacterium]
MRVTLLRTIVAFDAVFFMATLSALFYLVRGRQAAFDRGTKFVLAGLLLFTLVYASCLVVEWSGISDVLDKLEDFVGALIPMWWAFLFYAMSHEIVVEDVRKLNAGLEQRVQERTAQLESANRDLTEFAYVVSHDLKAPLRGVSQLAYWIAEDHAASLDDEGRHKINLLLGRVKRLYSLIDGILAYSRVGRVREKRESVDLNILVGEVIESLAPPESVEIVVENTLPTVVVERTRFEQVFQNLIGNALGFMDKPRGRIGIGCDDRGDCWRFAVRDNGPGIDPKYLDRIFGLFQTLAPRDQHEGTGVGLTLVKRIVELYGGRVSVESEVGQGAIFFFTLPKEPVT